MATTKVSALTAKTTPAGTEELLINDSGVSKKITIDNVTENNFTDTLKSKLDAIEASADVTDTTNVTSAGALMDSEVTNLAAVKAFDTTDYATAAQGTTADAALPKAGGTMTGDITLGTNVKAKFGASDDLQIYHDGSNSYIRDIGTGDLNISGDQIRILNASNNEAKAVFTTDGAVDLYHDNSKKLATTATGVDVTGGIDASNNIKIERSIDASQYSTIGMEQGNLTFDTYGTVNQVFKNAGSEKMRIDSSGNVGIGTTSPTAKLDVNGTLTCDGFTSTGIDDNATSTAITIDASENLLVGTGTSFTSKVNVAGDAMSWTGAFTGSATSGQSYGLVVRAGTTSADMALDVRDYTNNTSRFKVKGDGNVIVGTGNLVIGTSGKGIDFSATSDGSGTMTSEVLDDYEEGTFTPTITGSTSGSGTAGTGSYTKVGRMCTVSINIEDKPFPTFVGTLRMSLPFAAGNTRDYRGADIYFYPLSSWTSGSNFTGVTPMTTSTHTYMTFNVRNVNGDRQISLLSSNCSLSASTGTYARFSFTYVTS